MTTASLAAYDEAVKTMKGKRLSVFSMIQQSMAGFTIDELCEELGWKAATVSARVSELADRGLICEDAELSPRGAQTVWIDTPPEDVARLKAARMASKKQGDVIVVTVHPQNAALARLIVDIPAADWQRVKNKLKARFK